jgi:hypothetical protein
MNYVIELPWHFWHFKVQRKFNKPSFGKLTCPCFHVHLASTCEDVPEKWAMRPCICHTKTFPFLVFPICPNHREKPLSRMMCVPIAPPPVRMCHTWTIWLLLFFLKSLVTNFLEKTRTVIPSKRAPGMWGREGSGLPTPKLKEIKQEDTHTNTNTHYLLTHRLTHTYTHFPLSQRETYRHMLITSKGIHIFSRSPGT